MVAAMARPNPRKLLPKHATMVMRTWKVTRPQAEYLTKQAGELGVTVAEFVRRIIDEYRGRSPAT